MPHHIHEINNNTLEIVCNAFKKDIYPFPEMYDEFSFCFENTYQPHSKSISELEEMIDLQKQSMEVVCVKAYFVEKFLIPYLTSREESTKNEIRLANVLNHTFQFFVPMLERGMRTFQDDLYSKKEQLEKRRQKRKRYSENKKNARNTSGGKDH